MDNIITKLKACIFMDQGDIKYLDDIAVRINDPDKTRKLFCDFGAINKKSAKKLCGALQKLGFDATVDDFDRKIVNATKDVSYNNSKHALNIAMYEAYKYSSELITLMIEQDIKPNNKPEGQQ
ncbi:MAG TPA: hypothetical protein VFF33_14085 [Ignavibacteriaceae bacterium]|nr:hypothetical protein [Ignavibacteriaceae bacterium]